MSQMTYSRLKRHALGLLQRAERAERLLLEHLRETDILQLDPEDREYVRALQRESRLR